MAHIHHRQTAAVVTVVFALFLAACGTSSAPKRAPLAPAASVPPGSAITVTIRDFAYLPASVTVPPGATVTVRNEDLVVHTLTADNLAFNTGDLAQDQLQTFTAPTKPGRYPYHCLPHHYMTGVLTVS